MTTYADQLTFNTANLTISFKGKVVIDLTEIPENPSARIYSGLSSDFEGMPTTFSIQRFGQNPFNIGNTRLSLKAFLYSLVENRVEVEGMIIHDNLMEVYSHTIDRQHFTRWLYHSRHETMYPAQ